MAQDFVEIITPEAISNISKANKELGSLLQTLNITVSTANKLNISGGTSPTKLNASTAANNAQIERNIKALERQRLAEIKLAQDREKAFAKYEAQFNREQARLQAAQTLQARTAAQIKLLDAAYTELATKKARYNNLTDAEEKRLNTLTATLQKYRTIQDGVNSTVGKYQQRVGNYAGAFNPLSNSINQLTREFPAFANSFQTGFLAISNNLPIFFDAIQGVIAQNKELISQGQPVQSTFKQLASSIFSVGTALSLGVTLLTVFGGTLLEAITGTKDKTEADKAAKEAVEAKNKAEEEYNNNINRFAGEEISRSQILFQNAQNVNIKMRDRLQYISELRERYPDYLNQLSNEQILAGDTAEAEARLNDALLKRGIALALQEKIGKVFGKLTDEIIKQQSANEKLLKVNQTVDSFNETRRKQAQGDITQLEQINKGRNNQVLLATINAKKEIQNSKDRQEAIKGEIQSLFDLFNQYSPYLEVVREASDATNKLKDETEAYAETNSKVAFERNIAALEERLSLMSQENATYGILTGQLKILKGAYDALYGSQEQVNESTEKIIKFGTADYYNDRITKLRAEQAAVADNKDAYQLYERIIQTVQDDLDKLTGKTKDVEKLTDQTRKFLDSFSQGFLQQANLGSLNKFFDIDENGLSTFDKLIQGAENSREAFQVAFTAITEVAQETFNFLNQNSQAYFDAQYARLEREKETALQFAGESESGRREIERQFEEKRRETRRKEAESQKEQAIFNAVINTAQAVVAALPNLALSVLVGAIGAAQIALIASQQIPAYKDGTDFHKGGLARVGDGGKHELVHQPTLGWSITPNTDTLVNLERGSKVFPDLASSGIFNSDLPDMITLNGSSLTEQQMDKIMQKYAPQQSVNIDIGKKGLNTYINGQHTRTKILNDSVSFRSKNV